MQHLHLPEVTSIWKQYSCVIRQINVITKVDKINVMTTLGSWKYRQWKYMQSTMFFFCFRFNAKLTFICIRQSYNSVDTSACLHKSLLIKIKCKSIIECAFEFKITRNENKFNPCFILKKCALMIRNKSTQLISAKTIYKKHIMLNE